MATYVNLDHPQVLVQLANPSGDFDCKKDLFQIQGDYALALYDEKLEFLGYSHTRQGPLDKKCFPKMKKRLFSSKVKGYLLFLRKDHVKGLVERNFPELVVKPDSQTIKSASGNVPYEGTVRLNAGIIANGIGKMCKGMAKPTSASPSRTSTRSARPPSASSSNKRPSSSPTASARRRRSSSIPYGETGSISASTSTRRSKSPSKEASPAPSR